MKEIVFLSVEDVVIVHASAIEHEGGMGGTRDHGLLDAAVAMPRQQFGGAYFHEDVAAMAAAYLSTSLNTTRSSMGIKERQ